MESSTIEQTAATPATASDIAPIQNAFYQELTTQAQGPVAANLDLQNLISVDEGSLGDFPWFWQNTGIFTEGTYNWLNNIFSYNPGNPGGPANSNGYVQVTGSELTTAYFNTLTVANYTLSDASETAINNANTANAVIGNTVYNDWVTTFGPIPSTVPAATPYLRLNYIMTQVVGWGAADLTLSQLRNSLNPKSLLPNMPVGAETLVGNLMTYLGDTAAVSNIQSAVLSFNNQLEDLLKNVQNTPTAVGPGWMQVGPNIEPAMTIAEDPGTIHDGLHPASGTGNSFSVQMTATTSASNTVSVSTESGYGGEGGLDWLVGIDGSDQSTYNMSAFGEQTKACQVTITFNGVTKVTPLFTPYDISSRTGWWEPSVIQSAETDQAGTDGYHFTATPQYKMGNEGQFGVISALVISQQPTFELVYTSTDFHSFQQVFTENKSWGVSFLGIPLAGGSSSSYQAVATQDSTAGTITVKMSPPAYVTPVDPTKQLAFVVGAEMTWV